MTATAIDSNQLRLYYLRQLEIAAYVPRSASWVDVVPADALAPSEDAQAASPVVLRKFQLAELTTEEKSLPPATRSLPPKPQVAVPHTDAATAAAASADGAGITAFRLLFCVLDAELAIALQIPALSEPTLRERETQLLQNLLRWLGYPLPALHQLLHYQWPLPAVAATDNASAERMLTVFLQHAASAHSFRHLLVLGSAPTQCLQSVNAPWQPWCTHSLAELLAVPQLKRDTWLQLQPLWQHLQSVRG